MIIEIPLSLAISCLVALIFITLAIFWLIYSVNRLIDSVISPDAKRKDEFMEKIIKIVEENNKKELTGENNEN